MSNLSQLPSQPAACWTLVSYKKNKIFHQTSFKQMYMFKYAYRKVPSFTSIILKQGSYLNSIMNLFAIILALYV